MTKIDVFEADDITCVNEICVCGACPHFRDCRHNS